MRHLAAKQIHVDSGGYAIRGHRLHIPIFTHPEVSFDVCPHRYEPDPTHTPVPGRLKNMLAAVVRLPRVHPKLTPKRSITACSRR